MASDILAHLTENRPQKDLTVLQIIELYVSGYITLSYAKVLARRYVGDIAHLITWPRLYNRDD